MNECKMLKAFSRLAAPVFAIFSYLCAGVAAVLLVICLIVPLVNVPTEDMLLPPYMTTDGEVYEISLGNGIVIRSPDEQVTLDDIKVAVYCGIGVAVVVLLVLMPIFYLLSRLLKNVAAEAFFAMDNALRIKRIGLLILIGNTAALFAERFFNYYLVRTFLAEGEQVVFRAGIDIIGIVMGLFVILIGNIYGGAIGMHNNGMTGSSLSETDAVSPVSDAKKSLLPWKR